MQNRWNTSDAKKCAKDPVALQSYTAALFESLSPDLLAFSTVKVQTATLFGEATTQLHACQANDSKLLENIESLPLGALVHTCIPSQFVHQTRSASILAAANHAEEIFEGRLWIASADSNESSLVEKIQTIKLNDFEGILIPNIGLITYSDDAKQSYERSIELHNRAESYFDKTIEIEKPLDTRQSIDTHSFSNLRKRVSEISGHALVATLDSSSEAKAAISNDALFNNATRTDGNHEEALADQNDIDQILWDDQGIISFGICKDGLQGGDDPAAADCRLGQRRGQVQGHPGGG